MLNDLEYIGTNELNFKWYLNKSLTNWLHDKIGETKGLPKNYIVCDIYKDNKIEGRIILNKNNKEVISELDANNIEAAACKIDVIKVSFNSKN